MRIVLLAVQHPLPKIKQFYAHTVEMMNIQKQMKNVQPRVKNTRYGKCVRTVVTYILSQ